MATGKEQETPREGAVEEMDELLVIQQDLNAPKGQYNSFGKYKYRSCEDILAAVKPLLKETHSTLTLSDDIVMVGTRIYVKATATLRTASGKEYITSAYAREDEDKKGMDGSQITGAASSYARKYALNGLFSIDDTKDADATNTHGKEDSSGSQKNKPKTLTGELLKKAIAEMNAVRSHEELGNVWNRWACEFPTDCVNGSPFWNATAAKQQQLNQSR